MEKRAGVATDLIKGDQLYQLDQPEPHVPPSSKIPPDTPKDAQVAWAGWQVVAQRTRQEGNIGCPSVCTPYSEPHRQHPAVAGVRLGNVTLLCFFPRLSGDIEQSII